MVSGVNIRIMRRPVVVVVVATEGLFAFQPIIP